MKKRVRRCLWCQKVLDNRRIAPFCNPEHRQSHYKTIMGGKSKELVELAPLLLARDIEDYERPVANNMEIMRTVPKCNSLQISFDRHAYKDLNIKPKDKLLITVSVIRRNKDVLEKEKTS